MEFSINTIKNAYFIGIGGISMSSLAEILILKGINVYGYDMRKTDITENLEKKGAKITYSLDSDIPDIIDTVIYSAAIPNENPLLTYAKEENLTLLSRATLLGMISGSYQESIGISGTHGKSTTTGFVSSICLQEDCETAVLSGAKLVQLDSYYKTGTGKRIVYEACEYKNSYHAMPPSIKVVLNCDYDHVDFFPSIDDVIESFRKYIDTPRFNGSKNISVVNADCENSVKAAQNTSSEIYYFSTEKEADFYAKNIDISSGYGVFNLVLCDKKEIKNIKLSLPGMHNISNAVAAAAAAYLSGVSPDNIKKGLEAYKGVKRRFEKLGEYRGAKIIDDYAHHPDEIVATLTAARNITDSRIICVFQPHTYSRTYELLDDFANALSLADKVYMCEIFAAREENIYGVSSQNLAEKIKNCEYFPTYDEIAQKLKETLKDGEYCITMGAGEAYKVANILLGK